ncbi:MAG: Uma2 family endonuclease [bacterium]|nr:Uma2 family endonuclease [bacterium]
MGPAIRNDTQKYTYADYRSWDDGERWEIIGGEPYSMSPAPARIHQEISMELSRQFANQLLNKPCSVYSAPFDVRLPLADEDENTISNVVQPDISVICDPKKLDDKGCLGAPALIIEILSPATRRRDQLEKFNLFEMAGVKEYWMVEPDGQLVSVFILGPEGSYGRPRIYTETDTIETNALKNVRIDLSTALKNTANTQIEQEPTE